MITSQDVQQNIPKAVQWVTQIEQACMEIGHQLSTQSKRDARAIGVREIDLVRVMVLDETPLPTDRDLRKFILQTAICSKDWEISSTSEEGANGKRDREEPQLRKRLKHLTYKVH